MCCLFGLLDYGHTLSMKKRRKILRELAISSEQRGQDATGLAWFQNGRLEIQKAPKPATQFAFHLSPDAAFVMGHTRMTTQGSAARNYNNHPFAGCAAGTSFAFAHNGIFHNDLELRRTEHLPPTRIETDSYAAVQLLEKEPLCLTSIAHAAEKLEGTFTFTVLEKTGIYLVKGNNPLCVLDFPDRGFYLYASTELVMEQALRRLHLKTTPCREISIRQGEILHISTMGKLTKGTFDDSRIGLDGWGWYPMAGRLQYPYVPEDPYLEQVLGCARSMNISDGELRALLNAGYDAMDLEEMIYDPHFRQCCLEEIFCDWGCC